VVRGGGAGGRAGGRAGCGALPARLRARPSEQRVVRERGRVGGRCDRTSAAAAAASTPKPRGQCAQQRGACVRGCKRTRHARVQTHATCACANARDMRACKRTRHARVQTHATCVCANARGMRVCKRTRHAGRATREGRTHLDVQEAESVHAPAAVVGQHVVEAIRMPLLAEEADGHGLAEGVELQPAAAHRAHARRVVHDGDFDAHLLRAENQVRVCRRAERIAHLQAKEAPARRRRTFASGRATCVAMVCVHAAVCWVGAGQAPGVR
jgi:hypothetical protein